MNVSLVCACMNVESFSELSSVIQSSREVVSAERNINDKIEDQRRSKICTSDVDVHTRSGMKTDMYISEGDEVFQDCPLKVLENEVEVHRAIKCSGGECEEQFSESVIKSLENVRSSFEELDQAVESTEKDVQVQVELQECCQVDLEEMFVMRDVDEVVVVDAVCRQELVMCCSSVCMKVESFVDRNMLTKTRRVKLQRKMFLFVQVSSGIIVRTNPVKGFLSLCVIE